MQLRIAGRALGYDDTGSGPPVVLLHAFPFDRRLWATTVAALRARHRVIAVDARGFGESDLLAPYGMDDLADDLAALLDALGVPAAAVCGQSMGGYVALAMALRHPARLRALVLADTRAAADTPEARKAREQALATVRGAGPGPYLDGSLPRLLAPDAPAALRTEVRALAETRAESLLAGIAALRDRPDRTAALPAIAVPTLVVSGTADQVVAPAEMLAMSRAIRGSRFVSLEGSGHLPSVEAPGPLSRAIGDFLSSSSSSGGIG
jgi:3-oxoadipate enol-lactonase